MSALASVGVGWLPRTRPVRRVPAACSALLCIGAVINLGIASSWQASRGAAVFGIGIGGMLTLLPVV